MHNAFPLNQLLQSTGIQTWTWETGQNRFVLHATRTRTELEYPSLASFLNTIHPDDREQLETALQTSIHSGDDGHAMYRTINENQDQWIEARWVVNRDAETGSVYVFGINIEISLFTKHDQYLKAKDSAYQDLTNSIQDLLFVFDKDLRYLYWNKASEDFIGLSSNQVLGKHLFEIFPDTPEIRASESMYLEVLRTKNHKSFESQYLQAEKKYWFDVNIYPSSNGLIVLAKDITQKKQDEILLLETYKIQEAIFSQSLFGIFLMKMDNPVQWDETVDKEKALDEIFYHQHVTMANSALLAQYRTEANHFIGRPLVDFFAHDIPYGRQIWRDFLDHGWLQTFTDERKADGTPMWIEGDYQCLYDEQGRFIGHFGIQQEVTERKLAEKELVNQKERFQKILNEIPVYVIIVDPVGKFIMVNNAVQTDLGWTQDEWLEENVLQKCYPDPRDYDQVVKLINEANGQWTEYKTHTKTGKVIDTEWANFRLADGTTIGIGRNITSKKRFVEQIQESEMKFSTLFNRAPFPSVLSKPPDYRFVDVNEAWLQLFGYKRDEVIGKNSRDLEINRDTQTRNQTIQVLRETKSIRGIEQTLYTKKGNRVDAILNIDLLTIGGEEFVLNSLQDITQQKQIGNALRRSEALFKAITTHSPDHLLIQDRNLKYEFVLNPQLGLTVEDMIGKKDLELLPGQEGLDLTSIKMKIMKEGKPFPINVPLTNLTGQREYFEGTYVPRFDQNGTVDGLFGYFRNVTKQTIAEQELKRSIDDLNVVYQISKQLSQLYPIEILNKKIMEILDQYSYYEYAAILLLDHETGNLLPFAVSDKSRGPEHADQELENIRKLDLHIDKGITGWVVRNNKSYRSGNVRNDPLYIAIHPEINSEICVPLKIGSKILGVLSIETERLNAYHDADQSLLESIAVHISIAIENARLLEELKQTTENLERKVSERTAQLEQTLTQKSADEERQRLARELHDTVSQSMFSISLISESLPRLLALDSPLFLEGLNDLTRLSRGALAEMRTLLFELRPAAIQNIRLNELLHLMVNGLMSQSHLEVHMNLVGNHVLPESVRYTLFRITQEAFNNIIKHAHASTVTIHREDLPPIQGKKGKARFSGLKLSIMDDGDGFITKRNLSGMHGLSIMKERAKSIGATLTIRSKPGQGTQIIVIWRGEFLKEIVE